MSRLPVVIRAAKRHTKSDWPYVTGQVPGDVFAKLERLRLERAIPRSDIVREAVEYFLRHAHKAA